MSTGHEAKTVQESAKVSRNSARLMNFLTSIEKSEVEVVDPSTASPSLSELEGFLAA